MVHYQLKMASNCTEMAHHYLKMVHYHLKTAHQHVEMAYYHLKMAHDHAEIIVGQPELLRPGSCPHEPEWQGRFHYKFNHAACR